MNSFIQKKNSIEVDALVYWKPMKSANDGCYGCKRFMDNSHHSIKTELQL